MKAVVTQYHAKPKNNHIEKDKKSSFIFTVSPQPQDWQNSGLNLLSHKFLQGKRRGGRPQQPSVVPQIFKAFTAKDSHPRAFTVLDSSFQSHPEPGPPCLPGARATVSPTPLILRDLAPSGLPVTQSVPLCPHTEASQFIKSENRDCSFKCTNARIQEQKILKRKYDITKGKQISSNWSQRTRNHWIIWKRVLNYFKEPQRVTRENRWITHQY